VTYLFNTLRLTKCGQFTVRPVEFFPIFREKLLLKSSTYKPEKSGAGARGSPSVAQRRRAVGGKATRKKPRWGGPAAKGGQAELIGGILFINR